MGVYWLQQFLKGLYKPSSLLLMPICLFFLSCKSDRIARNDLKKKDSRNELQAKFGIKIPEKHNDKLLNTLASWLNTPYQFGGSTRKGSDCSGMVKSVYLEVYGLNLERSAVQQKEQAKKIPERKLKEGDLVFFAINSKKIDHVGLYLWKGYFIHASTSKGVVLNSLSEPYYRKAFTGAGTFFR